MALYTSDMHNSGMDLGVVVKISNTTSYMLRFRKLLYTNKLQR